MSLYILYKSLALILFAESGMLSSLPNFQSIRNNFEQQSTLPVSVVDRPQSTALLKSRQIIQKESPPDFLTTDLKKTGRFEIFLNTCAM